MPIARSRPLAATSGRLPPLRGGATFPGQTDPVLRSYPCGRRSWGGGERQRATSGRKPFNLPGSLPEFKYVQEAVVVYNPALVCHHRYFGSNFMDSGCGQTYKFDIFGDPG